ncbi:MAG TPA: ArdC-like ssDNA-binding domain-containing protein [Methylobacter sp.]
MNKQAIQHQALKNAITNQSTMNYEGIFDGFMEKGISPDDIKPRENIFTFDAWLALGRVVRKGEKGVKVVTFIKCEKKDKESGEVAHFRRPKTTTVFHISQTKELETETATATTTEQTH